MSIVYDTKKHFELFGTLYVIMQITCIYILATKKIYIDKFKKIAQILSTLAIITALLFFIESLDAEIFRKYFKITGFIMILLSGFIKGILKNKI
ncbi:MULTISPECIES: hypothetical protein [unclassified Clostridium]|uniref:hypothetical protein n=1 Tax=unclassified Clostridium TaxID=2614128 RepID=UPI00207A1905|nr:MULTISPECIES: hypothetical protein [unclassified Clostridium]